MEQETLFTASKWDILTELEKGTRSPVELAKILNTSVANISQQLRLLEMAGLVESKRISNREKGLPRILYSLSGNHSYLIAAAKEFVDKKFLRLTERNKVTLRIWFLDDPELHYFLEKAFWSIDENLSVMDLIALDKEANDLTLAIVSNDSSLKQKLKKLKLKNPDGVSKEICFKVLNEKEFKSSDKYYPLYNPKGLIKIESEKEGGDSEK